MLVSSASNLRFGPEVGVGKLEEDALVIGPWLSQMDKMADDLRLVAGFPHSETDVSDGCMSFEYNHSSGNHRRSHDVITLSQ